jgi:hypothetical protein
MSATGAGFVKRGVRKGDEGAGGHLGPLDCCSSPDSLSEISIGFPGPSPQFKRPVREVCDRRLTPLVARPVATLVPAQVCQQPIVQLHQVFQAVPVPAPILTLDLGW